MRREKAGIDVAVAVHSRMGRRPSCPTAHNVICVINRTARTAGQPASTIAVLPPATGAAKVPSGERRRRDPGPGAGIIQYTAVPVRARKRMPSSAEDLMPGWRKHGDDQNERDDARPKWPPPWWPPKCAWPWPPP